MALHAYKWRYTILPHLRAFMPQLQKWCSNFPQLPGLLIQLSVCLPLPLLLLKLLLLPTSVFLSFHLFFFNSAVFVGSTHLFFAACFGCGCVGLCVRGCLSCRCRRRWISHHFLANCWRFLCAWSMDAKPCRAGSFSPLQHMLLHLFIHSFIYTS